MADQINELGAMFGMLQQGFTPEQARARVDEARAMQFAQLSPSQQRTMMGFQAGQGLGRGISSLFGVQQEDPTVRMATQLRELQTQFDTTTAEGMMQYARALQSVNPQMAQQAALMAQQMATKEATVAKTRAEQQRIEAQAGRERTSFEREQKLQEALSALPDDASESQLLGVFRKHGDPKQVASALENSQKQRAQIQARMDEQEARARAQLERDRELAKDRAERDEAQRRFQMELERIRQEGRRDQASFVAALKSSAPQNMDDKAAQQALAITTAQPVINEGSDLIKKLYTPEGKRVEAFTLTQRGGAALAALAGKSTETGKLQSDVESFLKRARNAYLLAAKGTQTEGDAKRAMEQFFNQLDFTTAEGVERSIKRVQDELRNQQNGASAYLTSRGFKPPEVRQAEPTAAAKDNFSVGQIYRDAKGNRAEYLGNGKWKEIK